MADTSLLPIALQIAAQLPADTEAAVAVLALAADLVRYGARRASDIGEREKSALAPS